MNKYVMMLAVAGLVSFGATAGHAAEEAKMAPAAKTEAPAAKEVTLEDGTKVSIEGESVFVVAADGTKTAAPDGDHKEKDGTVLKVKEGKLVK